MYLDCHYNISDSFKTKLQTTLCPLSGRKLVVNFQAFDEREMHRKMAGAMLWSILCCALAWSYIFGKMRRLL